MQKNLKDFCVSFSQNLKRRVNQQETFFNIFDFMLVAQPNQKSKQKKNNIKKGSSETTREAFCFNLYAKYKPEHVKSVKKQFLQWFIGLSEGNGSFQIWKDKGKQRINFTIEQKDPQVLQHIRTELGFGQILKCKGYWRFYVGDKKNLHRLYCIFAGNIVLSKKHLDFTKWASFIEFPPSFSIDKEVALNIENNKYSGANLISLNNAWLAGFFQAEGSFYAWSDPTRLNIILRIYISQKGEIQALERIQSLIPTELPASQGKKKTLNSLGITVLPIIV